MHFTFQYVDYKIRKGSSTQLKEEETLPKDKQKALYPFLMRRLAYFRLC